MRSPKVLVLPGIENLASIAKEFSPEWSIVGGRFRDITFKFDNGKTEICFKGKDLRKYEYIWLSSGWDDRDLAYAISLYLSELKIPHTPVEKAGSKIVDQVLFTMHGIPTPVTCFTTRRSAGVAFRLVRECCGFPAIVKDIYGARGRYSKMIEKNTGLESVFKKLKPGRRFMFQRFVPNEYDWGVLVVNGEVKSAEKSYRADGEFRNNACRKAKEIFIPVGDVPDDVKEIAIKAAELLGLSWSRSDIIVNKETGEPLLLEVNRFPGTTFGSGEIVAASEYLKGRLAEVK